MNNQSPILPIGKVNLTTAKNAMFGVLWDCWEKDENSANILLKGADYNNQGKMRVVHTSGNVGSTKSWHPVGKKIEFCHDQDRYSMGVWEVVSVHPHTEAGLLEIKAASGKSSLGFATY